MTALTDAQANFVYNIEVMGMPANVAAKMAGMPITQIADPGVMSQRIALRKELQGRLALTKEDVLSGVQDAIHDAKLLADPTAQIKGWQVINEMMGWNAAQKVDLTLNMPLELAKKNIRQLKDAELIKLLGAETIIDGDFYEVQKAT